MAVRGRLHCRNKTPDSMPSIIKPYQWEMLAMKLDWKTKTKTEKDVVSMTDEERPLHVVQQNLSMLVVQNNEPH